MGSLCPDVRDKGMKKLFVVTDIHGHYTLLKEALDRAGFDPAQEDHVLLCCGDYFDRGNENVEVMRFFERLPRKILLRGNHEDMLLKLLQTGKLQRHHYMNGTLATLQSFFGKYAIDPSDDSIDFSGKTSTVNRLLDFISETVDYYETERYVFVHGWLPENVSTQAQRQNATKEDWEKARWVKWTEKYDGRRPLPEKILICGHLPTFFANKFDPLRSKDDAGIFRGSGLIALDAGTFDSHQVNVLVLEDAIAE